MELAGDARFVTSVRTHSVAEVRGAQFTFFGKIEIFQALKAGPAPSIRFPAGFTFSLVRWDASTTTRS